jgi:hypothetical protein
MSYRIAGIGVIIIIKMLAVVVADVEGEGLCFSLFWHRGLCDLPRSAPAVSRGVWRRQLAF